MLGDADPGNEYVMDPVRPIADQNAAYYASTDGSGPRGWYRCRRCEQRADVANIRFIPGDHVCDSCRLMNLDTTICRDCKGAGSHGFSRYGVVLLKYEMERIPCKTCEGRGFVSVQECS